MAAEIRKLRDLVREHVSDSFTLKKLEAGRRRFAIVEECGEDFCGGKTDT